MNSRGAAFLVVVATGLLVPLLFVAVRIWLEPLAGVRAPYALNFFAVCVATVLAGWRAGMLAAVLGSALLWWLIVSAAPGLAQDSQSNFAFLLAILSQLLIVALLGLYQREVDKGTAERERRIALTEEARREIDHRVANYFQTVLSLAQLQAQRATDAQTKAALEQIIRRISAISIASEQLSHPHDPLSTVRLRDHLAILCEQLSKGLTWDGVTLHCDLEDVPVGSTVATYLGVIVNELVTNSLKHAFIDKREGEVRVETRQVGDGLQVTIADDGQGMRQAVRESGLGRRLVAAFVRELGASHAVDSSSLGTRHTIVVPSLT